MILALEKTTNTHRVEAPKIIVDWEDESSVMLRIDGPGLVTHGEHGPIHTEAPFVLKYVQKEVNPITKKIEDAND